MCLCIKSSHCTLEIFYIIFINLYCSKAEKKIYSSNNPKLKKLAAFNKDNTVVIAEEKTLLELI